MTQIEIINYKTNNFFIDILSYCAIHQKKNISMFSDLSNKMILAESQDWVRHIVKRKHFALSKNLKAIYLFFPYQSTVQQFELIFSEVNFDEYNLYFINCYEELSNDIRTNKLEFFKTINFFHLIGSFRYFVNKDNRATIDDHLYKIIQDANMPVLIQYSALQIMSLIDLHEKNDITEYCDYESFKKTCCQFIDNLETDKFLRNYISFYSMFYYENAFDPIGIIESKHFMKIIIEEGGVKKIDFKYLHQLIIQISALLIRIDKQKYVDLGLASKLKILYDEVDEFNYERIEELRDLISVKFKK